VFFIVLISIHPSHISLSLSLLLYPDPTPTVRDDPESVWIVQAISRFCQLCTAVAPVWEEAVASSAGLLRMGRVHYDRQQTLGRRLNVRRNRVRGDFSAFYYKMEVGILECESEKDHDEAMN
jgi:hypothetical protein